MPGTLLLFAQQQISTHEGMYWIMLVSRILHMLGAIMLLGGLFYLCAVIAPTIPRPGRDGQGQGSQLPVEQYLAGRRGTWMKWARLATTFLLVTGLWNYYQYQRTYDLHRHYHMIMGLKFLAALGVFLFTELLAGKTHAAESIRRNWHFWLNVTLTLGFFTVVLGSMARSLSHNPKHTPDDTPAISAPAKTATT
jgi:uncharacterized membrane protein